MLYHVEFVRQPIVLEADGRSAADPHVVEITFPDDASETALGCMNPIDGADVAEIIVSDATSRGVTLC